MSIPLQLTFRDMDPTPALEALVRDWTNKLERVYPRIERCDVMIERPHQHQHKGQLFHVRVSVAVPGPDIVISRDQALDGAREDVYVAIRDAFRAARRQLEGLQHRRRLEIQA